MIPDALQRLRELSAKWRASRYGFNGNDCAADLDAVLATVRGEGPEPPGPCPDNGHKWTLRDAPRPVVGAYCDCGKMRWTDAPAVEARAPHAPPTDHEAPALHHYCIESGAWCRVLKRWEPDGAAQQFDYECTRCKQRIIVNVGEFKLEAQASRPAPPLDWQPSLPHIALLVEALEAVPARTARRQNQIAQLIAWAKKLSTAPTAAHAAPTEPK